MEKIQSKIVPQNPPSLEEWLKEFKVSSTYNKLSVLYDIKESNRIKNFLKI